MWLNFRLNYQGHLAYDEEAVGDEIHFDGGIPFDDIFA